MAEMGFACLAEMGFACLADAGLLQSGRYWRYDSQLMHWIVSPDVEAVLWDAAPTVLPVALCRGSTLRQAVTARSLRLTRERTAESAWVPLSGREAQADLAAHALFFAPADATKVMIPLAELHGRGLLFPHRGKPLRLLDVGAGPGAMTLGVLDFVHRIGHPGPIHAYAIDRDRAAMRIYQHATRALAKRCEIPFQAELDPTALTSQRRYPSADLVVVGQLLNELSRELARSVIHGLLQALPPHGALIVIEPALRETTRALHELRDELLHTGAAHVFAPCVRRQAPCPALSDLRDWCHEDRPVQLSEKTARLANNTGLRTHGLKFAYLVLRHGGESQVPEPARAARVVSHPRRGKGVRTCFTCSDDGRVQVRRLKRHRSAENRSFERVRRGDVLAWDSEPPPNGDIRSDTRVTLLHPAAFSDTLSAGADTDDAEE